MITFQNNQFAPQIRAPKDSSPVSVHTEWEPLEEVIVGEILDARVPDWHVSLESVLPQNGLDFFKKHQAGLFPHDQILLAQKELDGLADFLTSEGIKVVRPTPLENIPFQTPCFTSSGSFYSAMPRDCLLAIGDLIIEAPMAWRSRYFETFGFRRILNDYFNRGSRWISAPKPTLCDDLYRRDFIRRSDRFESVLTEFEPVFDAADFFRLGLDIIGQLSHVTNRSGVEWLQRHLGPEYKIHIYDFDDAQPMHIDTTILPLAPGKVLVNREWVSKIPACFKDWEILHPPKSVLPQTHPLYMTSAWISTNVLMLDEKRVLVEEQEEPLIEAFKKWGFQPIGLPFRNFQSFGGSFHCATLDVRRTGKLRSYLS